jgi:DNA-binding transcriptional regulator GbsR (MarR family)
MSRLSKTNTYAVLWLNHTGMSVEDIVKELDITINQVNGVLEKNNVTNTESPVKTTQNPVNISNKNLMITETMNKKSKTVAIMTQQASSANDELRKKNTNNNSKKDNSSIFRPR